MRRLPILATLIVLAAVAVMLRLGFWQLDRMHQKEALLVRYNAAQQSSAEVLWPADPADRAALMFRRSRIDCRPSRPETPLAGHNAAGQTGWAHAQSCQIPGGASAEVLLGWSPQPQAVQWSGGLVTGTIGPSSGGVVRLIADPPLAGLAANARPDPASVPNNHWSYAVQWFLFAGVALVIYALALRKRMRGG